ncbi:hypothetical protein JOE58_000670 [Curtobacterium luteum]|uniref:Uncharacterized protein n=1 Tax=Curtobacterium luteum TaxID=33881 RepID=A0A8H9KZN5_9MICO|nr:MULTISPECIES: hypothetical protein [Curtobacterium]MBM7801419.1 hypothetical protein [Curtobacterium luteum]NUU49913.1 hypothetical protein [Curtobacterium luteum]GGK90590.1 hypothetical protein GCM10009769_05880 [Curtobacterium luteum]
MVRGDFGCAEPNSTADGAVVGRRTSFALRAESIVFAVLRELTGAAGAGQQ